MVMTIKRTESSDLYRKICAMDVHGMQRQEALAILRKVEWLASTLGAALSLLRSTWHRVATKAGARARLGRRRHA